MSRGEILQHLGDAKYRVRLFYAVDRVKAEIAKIDVRIAELAVELPTKKTELVNAEQAVKDKAAQIDALIPSYQSDPAKYGAQIKQLQTDLIELQRSVSLLRFEVDRLIAEDLSLKKRRGQLKRIPEDKELDAWCADYTPDLSGEVGLVDVNDEGAQGVIVQPGDSGEAPYDSVRDGILMPREAQSGAQAYFNAAVLPGVQKWLPRYRIGTISNIVNDTCVVMLDSAQSSAQGLGINEFDMHSDVPIQYMTCNGDAFEDGDKVLVRFFDSGPQVVGFANNPRPCGTNLLWRSIRRETDTLQYPERWVGNISVGGDVTLSSQGTNRDSYALFQGDYYFTVPDGDIGKNGAEIVNTPDTWSINDIRVVKNNATGLSEIWISAIDHLGAAIAQIYDLNGNALRSIILAGSASYAGGYVFLSCSPNYYAWADNGGVVVKKNIDDSTVMALSWCGTGPHEQNGLLDITDELVVFACYGSVDLRRVSDGTSISVSVDMAYLEFSSVVVQGLMRGIQGVQLSNDTLTVFGSIRLIHYKILRDEGGLPNGVAEVTRYQYDAFENYNLNVSSERSNLKSIPPE